MEDFINVTVVLEHRFDRTPDGAVWTQTMFARSFWQRYLAVFGSVTVVARVLEVEAVPEGYVRVDSDKVRVHAVPHYLGLAEYALQARAVKVSLRTALAASGAVILRVPGTLSMVASSLLERQGRRYALEVVGDPAEMFAPGTTAHPLRPFLQFYFPLRLRQQCRRAGAAAYVTEHALQRRYPPDPGAFITHYSSIELRDEAFAAAPREARAQPTPLRLVTVGSLAHLQKATDVLISAVARNVQAGLELHLTVVGDGGYRAQLEQQAAALGVAGQVRFAGQLRAGDAVRQELAGADLFVLPSRQEGLPRAMIEAMAAALPCLGSTAGGIGELLPDGELVRPGDDLALAQKVREVATDPERLAAMSRRNLAKAQGYHERLLASRRLEFYRHVRLLGSEQPVGPELRSASVPSQPR